MTRLAELELALRDEQVDLWCDLDWALRNAIPTEAWSIAAIGVAHRIRRVARLVGATPWQQVAVVRLVDGTYENVLNGMFPDAATEDEDGSAIPFAPIDWPAVHAFDERLRRVARG